jgi:cytochrome P450
MSAHPSVRHSPVPGPKGSFLVGSGLAVLRDPLGEFLEAARVHGDVVKFKMGPYSYVLLNSAEGVKHLLVDHAKNYVKSRSYDGLRLVLGEGLVTSEGEHWRKQRKLAQPAFHRERLASFVSMMANDTSAMLDRWTREGRAEVDMHEEMMRLTYRIVARTLCGVDVDPDEETGARRSPHRIGEAIATALQFANDYAESLVRLPTWWPSPANLRFKRAAKVLDGLVLGIIEERRQQMAHSHGDLLELLMAARYDDGTGMSDRQLRDEVMTIVLAGHETTANALTWTWTLLSQHPDVARMLQAEVDAVIADRTPTIEDIPKLRYTAMVVQEAMRLYPPVWVFERQALEEDVICGYAIPKGTVVAVSPYTLHRNPRYWDNPEGFDPTRFSPENVERRPKHTYLPFSVGPRQCIGSSFALMEAQIIVAMTARRFRPSLVSGHRVEPDPKVTLRPKHALPMVLAGR